MPLQYQVYFSSAAVHSASGTLFAGAVVPFARDVAQFDAVQQQYKVHKWQHQHTNNNRGTLRHGKGAPRYQCE